VSVYPELDNLGVDELIALFDTAPLDGEEGAVAFYQEVADKLGTAGPNGVEQLWRATQKWTDVPRQRALILALSCHAEPTEELRGWIRERLDDDPDVAAEAIDALARIGDDEVRERVVKMYEHPSEYVRGAVVRYVCRRAPDEAWPLVERAAADPHFIVRENAADELAGLGDGRARPILERLAKDANSDVRQAAQSALDELGDA
jgi:HEAT repeat protein